VWTHPQAVWPEWLLLCILHDISCASFLCFHFGAFIAPSLFFADISGWEAMMGDFAQSLVMAALPFDPRGGRT
jgi:hypothetical protein